MLTKEQLGVIKRRVNQFEREKSSVVEAEIAIAIAECDVPALIAEVERLQRFEQKAIYAIEENRKLREALEFYADEENYKGFETSITIGDTPHYFETNNIEIDNGSIAEKALGGDEDE